MKLVTLVNIILNRPNDFGGFQSSISNGFPKERKATVIVQGDQPGDILEKVKELALQHGGNENQINSLVVSTPFSSRDGMIHFKEGNDFFHGIQYGNDYAVCDVYSALEIDGRYFRLQEVDITS